jgi:proteic killer suppression protein
LDFLTKVTHSRVFEKQLDKVPQPIRRKALDWVYFVETLGLRTVSQSKGLHDEPLSGRRWGQRSVRLNRSYRLIYRIIEEQIHIELLEVHKHDY